MVWVFLIQKTALFLSLEKQWLIPFFPWEPNS